jgi:hypothetical protein
VRLDAAASSCVRAALTGPARPSTWLGVTPAALYLRTPSAPGVVALLAHDAVRLPCSLLLPTIAAELPLTSIAGGAMVGDAMVGDAMVGDAMVGDAMVGDAMVGDDCLAWTGPAGPVVVRAVREWAPAQVRPGRVAAEALAALRDALPTPADLGIDGALVRLLTTEPTAAVAGLLGRGPGLTPAGDDVLAGFLLGARAFGLDAAGARATVAAMAPIHTTALSAALLWHADRGECISEVAVVAAALTGLTDHKPIEHGLTGHCGLEHALGRLLDVGHTSGGALALGLAAAGTTAVGTGRVTRAGGEAA